MPLWVRRADVLAVLALLAGLAVGLVRYADRAPADPDRHFHFALARLWAEQGPPKTLPQVADIGWDQAFVDKEFLFHVATWLGWLVAERAGVVAVSALLAALIVVLLFLLARQFLEPLRAALVVAAAVSCPMFLYRLALVRPHLLAIAATLLLLLGLVRTSWRLTLAGGLVFALGYHALYVPLAVLGLFAVGLGKSARVSVAAGVGGLALGTVANPYFPGTLQTTWMTLTIAASKPTGSTFGGELFPIRPSELLDSYSVPAVMFLLSVAFALRARYAPFPRTRFTLVACAALFWALCFRSARASEYAIPFTAVALASIGPAAPGRWFAPVLALGLFANVPLLAESMKVTTLDRYTMKISEAVDALPPAAKGHKVLNCSFPEGEVVLDRRPDVKVVDVLDPTFLERFDRTKHEARLLLIEGEARELKALVTKTFGARYVICGFPAARRLLDDHPDFRRLRPPPGPPLPFGSGPYLYEVRSFSP